MKNETLIGAMKIGFDISQFESETMEEIQDACIEYLNENVDKLPNLEDECEVDGHGSHQTVSYGDFCSSGEIINWGSYMYGVREKIYHSDFLYIDDETGEPYNMKLWCWSKSEALEKELNEM